MYLIDTSVWIDSLRQVDNAPARFFKSMLGALPFYHPRDPVITHAAAAALYRRCRERGITVRSTLDCLIAQIAIEHDLLLVHHDRDFDQLVQACPELKCAPMGIAH